MKKTLATGHHGTSARMAATIVAEGFRVSKNNYDWLGDGAYFFQDAPLRALTWADSRFGKDASVIECEVEIRDFIDLIDIKWAAWLALVHDRLIDELRAARMIPPVQKGKSHRLDRDVLNYGIGLLEAEGLAVRGVRGAFTEGMPAYPNSALFTQSHVQIAVRDLSLISKARIVPVEEIRNAREVDAATSAIRAKAQ